jgi:hypothetical protein
VDKLNYLGHCINTNRHDSLTSEIISDFNCKVNSILAHFSGISSVVKHSLYEKYCTAFYGSNLMDFSNSGAVNTFCKQWRKAIRRILCVPPRTHSRYLPHIVNTAPVDITLMQRFIKFFYSGANSKNDIVSSLFRMAVTTQSRLGSNLRYILSSYTNVSINLHHNVNKLCNQVQEHWLKLCLDEDIRVGAQITELIEQRDSLVVRSNFTYSELSEMIEFLCLS